MNFLKIALTRQSSPCDMHLTAMLCYCCYNLLLLLYVAAAVADAVAVICMCYKRHKRHKRLKHGDNDLHTPQTHTHMHTDNKRAH